MSDWLKILELTTRSAEAAAREREARHRESEARIKAGFAPLPQPVNHALAQALAMNELMSGQPVAKEPKSDSAFELEGDTCRVVIQGKEKRYRTSLGFRYLDHLGSNIGQSFAPEELEAAVKGTELPVLEGTPERVMDSQSMQAAKQRLIKLKEQREEAECRGDTECIDRINDETNSIKKHLSAAIGLKGKPRRFAGGNERARKRVCQAIDSAVERLAKDFPQFAADLRSLLTTGSRISVEKPKTP